MPRPSTRPSGPGETPQTRVTAQTIKRWAQHPGIHRDPESRGLALRVRGPIATWVLRYYLGGVPRIWTIGRYPDLGLADAREQADHGRTRVAKGEDPAADKRLEKARVARERANNIEALCAAYIERHAKPRKRTWRDDQSTLKHEVLTRWEGRPVASITRRDCRDVVQAIADRGGLIYANRVVALLSRVFRFAVDEEIIAANPAAHLPKPGVEAQARPDGEQEQKAYDTDEIRKIWQATETMPPAIRAQVRLGLITAQRPGEITDLEWSEIEGAWWTIPGRRTKNGRVHRVFLTPLALDILNDVPRVEGGRYAFAGYRGKPQLRASNKLIFADVRRREKPRHALRSTVATGLATCGVSTEDISKVLNHAYGPRVTAGYNEYAYDKEKRLALGKWARRLERILKSKDESKVLSFAKA